MMKSPSILLGLALCATASLYAGCSTQPIEPPIGQPGCNDPILITSEIWNDLGMIREVITFNQLMDEKCIEKLRARIRIHDENL